MSAPSIPDLQRIKVARRVNALLNQFVGVLDTKASMFLAGSVAAASFLLKDAPHNMWCRVIYFSSLSAYSASVVMAGATIFPRLPKTGNSVLFWGDISSHKDIDSYVNHFDSVLGSGKLDEQYLAQNYHTARLLRRKYVCLRASIILFFIGLFTSFAVFLSVSR
jgi:pycsar effector protein